MKTVFNSEKQYNNRQELETCLEVFQKILKSRTGYSLYIDEPEIYNSINETINILEYRLHEDQTIKK